MLTTHGQRSFKRTSYLQLQTQANRKQTMVFDFTFRCFQVAPSIVPIAGLPPLLEGGNPAVGTIDGASFQNVSVSMVLVL